MGDILANGVSGLQAFQSALDTTSHNISNVNTPGYSRQRVNLLTNQADAGSTGWVGSGVAVGSITRSYDELLAGQTRSASSAYQQLNTVGSLGKNIDNLFSDQNSGISASLQNFTNSIQTMASSPADASARRAVLSQAQTLVARLRNYDGSLRQIDLQVNTQLGTEAGSISTLARSIANLNQKIIAAKARSQQPPNDLLDQRDKLIDELSQHVNVNTVGQSDGSVNVFVGTGQPLVVGAVATTLAVTPDQFHSGAVRLALQTVNGSVDITDALSGGTLGGALQFRNQMLTPAHNTLGQTAVALATLMNAQNKRGLDRNGQPGTDLFAVGGVRTLSGSANAGNAAVAATVTDLQGLTTGNYYLKRDDGGWVLTDTATGVGTALHGSGTAADPLVGAGMSFVISGSAHTGDRFLVQPTGEAVSGLKLLTSEPAKIAAAEALVAAAASGNAGGAQVDDSSIEDRAAWVRGSYTLKFTSPTSYTVADAGGATVAQGKWKAGAPIAFKGIELRLSGTPAAGDSFSIRDNANGSGDNRNALKLAAILDRKALGGGTQSIGDVVSQYVGAVGLQIQQAQSGAAAQQNVMQSAQNAQESLSGVNLDEEAANMVRFERAYQAAAQTIKIADTLFQSLLDATRR